VAARPVQQWYLFDRVNASEERCLINLRTASSMPAALRWTPTAVYWASNGVMKVHEGWLLPAIRFSLHPLSQAIGGIAVDRNGRLLDSYLTGSLKRAGQGDEVRCWGCEGSPVELPPGPIRWTGRVVSQ